MRQTVTDGRSAEVTTNGLTAGKHIPTMETILEGDAPDSVWVCDHCDHSTDDVDAILDHLRNDHNPDDDRSHDNLDRLADLIKETTAARGVDVYAVKVWGIPADSWAEMTDRNPSTVYRNIRRATTDT